MRRSLNELFKVYIGSDKTGKYSYWNDSLKLRIYLFFVSKFVRGYVSRREKVLYNLAIRRSYRRFNHMLESPAILRDKILPDNLGVTSVTLPLLIKNDTDD